MAARAQEFRPTHVAPATGLPACAAPGDTRPAARLDPLLPVQLADRRGDWGRIVCSNGWTAWVDSRLLVAVPQVPPAASGPPGGAADVRPLLAELERALSRYRHLTEELAAGRIDGETFRRRTEGTRIGAVVDGEAIWLFDAERDRWVYCEAATMGRLSTYAAVEPPSTEPRTVIERPRP
jgi:ketosteroid isomerase-like protein